MGGGGGGGGGIGSGTTTLPPRPTFIPNDSVGDWHESREPFALHLILALLSEPSFHLDCSELVEMW